MKNLLVCASCITELSEFQLVKGMDLPTGELVGLGDDVDVLVSGVGSWLSTFNLTRVLSSRRYNLVLFVGICGEYKMERDLLRLSLVDRTTFVDCGFEDADGGFVSLIGSKFLPKDAFSFSDGWLVSKPDEKIKATSMLLQLPRCAANTVQRCCYNREHVDGLVRRYPADIETMESAAFHFVCQQMGQPYAEVRCTSNYVDKQSVWLVRDSCLKIGGLLNRIVLSPGS